MILQKSFYYAHLLSKKYLQLADAFMQSFYPNCMASEDFKNIYCFSYAKVKWGQLNNDRMFILGWTITLTFYYFNMSTHKNHMT